MKENKLKSILKSKSRDFDKKPNPELWSRLEGKLDSSAPSKTKWTIVHRKWLLAASMIGIVLTAVILSYNLGYRNATQNIVWIDMQQDEQTGAASQRAFYQRVKHYSHSLPEDYRSQNRTQIRSSGSDLYVNASPRSLEEEASETPSSAHLNHSSTHKATKPSSSNTAGLSTAEAAEIPTGLADVADETGASLHSKKEGSHLPTDAQSIERAKIQASGIEDLFGNYIESKEDAFMRGRKIREKWQLLDSPHGDLRLINKGYLEDYTLLDEKPSEYYLVSKADQTKYLTIRQGDNTLSLVWKTAAETIRTLELYPTE